VPFTGSVRLRKMVIVCDGGDSVAVFKNVSVDFDCVDRTAPTQTFTLVPNEDATIEYTVNAPKFNDCRMLVRALLYLIVLFDL
jgi:hypothetical protein